MRILYITSANIPGNKAHSIQIMRLCEGFAKEGNNVVLFVPKQKGIQVEDILSFYGTRADLLSVKQIPTVGIFPRGTILYYYSRFYSFFFLSILYSFFISKDVIITRDWQYALFSSRVAYNLHEILPSYISHTYALALKRACAIIIPNAKIAHSLSGHNIPSERIIVVSNGVSFSEFMNIPSKESKRALEKIINISISSRKVVLYSGSFKKHKGVEILAQSAKFLPDEYIIVCIGGDTLQVRKLESKFSKSNNIFFLKYIDPRDIPRLLLAADILVVPNIITADPSSGDTSPIKLFEYMATGIPVVVSDLPTIREIVTDREVWLTKSGDPLALADTIQKTQIQIPEAGKRADSARKLARKCSWRNRAQQISSFVHQCCNI
ncbi:MAG: glycosyltransferase [Candidatus Paceibacterota bacterium]